MRNRRLAGLHCHIAIQKGTLRNPFVIIATERGEVLALHKLGKHEIGPQSPQTGNFYRPILKLRWLPRLETAQHFV